MVLIATVDLMVELLYRYTVVITRLYAALVRFIHFLSFVHKLIITLLIFLKHIFTPTYTN